MLKSAHLGSRNVVAVHMLLHLTTSGKGFVAEGAAEAAPLPGVSSEVGSKGVELAEWGLIVGTA